MLTTDGKNFFGAYNCMRYVIYASREFNGGGLVLRELARLLEKKGCDVRLISVCRPSDRVPLNRVVLTLKSLLQTMVDVVKRFWDNAKQNGLPYARYDIKRKFFAYVNRDDVVVYPEIVLGNPLHAKNVVRWFLYHNRFPNDPDAYGKNELVFSFREHFNDYKLNPSCRLFTLNYFDKDLYKQTNFEERDGVCYIIRKGKNRPDLPKTFDGPVIDDLPEKEKVAVFNHCKYCYDYDTQTFYTSIACVCGCIPIIVMEPGKKKSDYLGKGDVDYGKAYGDAPEEIEYAVETRPLRLKMLDFEERNKKNIDFFVNEVQNYFQR